MDRNELKAADKKMVKSLDNAISSVFEIKKILKNGFEFYNIEIEQCPINPNIKTGQLIGAGNWGYLTTNDNK